ncbi:LysR substrate-binding domain-containing protein [Pseudorhodoferax sp. Leaf274]|uniref:LysR substrate-binding domain-containing protein n=1 Tax=Pseudorhodoferax sp. Leaf274 TaxID=1736318 RepID=UPI001F378358|nr:LysR substrate-binding domain-containing protein [Pseudorhodoferax sp. Leaf274]
MSYPRDPNSSFARQAIQALGQAGARPQVRYEAQEIHTALGLVSAGLGFALVGRSVADHNRKDMRFLPVSKLVTTARVFAIRQKDAPNELVDAFLAIALEQSASR